VASNAARDTAEGEIRELQASVRAERGAAEAAVRGARHEAKKEATEEVAQARAEHEAREAREKGLAAEVEELRKHAAVGPMTDIARHVMGCHVTHVTRVVSCVE
jgi:hypothetical protein